MNDRQRLEAIVDVVVRYLLPHGISIKDAMSEIIKLVDPLPDLPKREWVGLTNNEIQEIVNRINVDDLLLNTSTWHLRFARAVQRKLKEKNT